MTQNNSLTREQKRMQHMATARSYIMSYVMVLPAMFFLFTFVLYPAANMFALSLYKGNLVKPYKTWLGLDNYNSLFFVRDDFWVALRNTGLYTLYALISVMVFSLLFAQWLYKPRKLNNIAQTLFFTPHLVAGISAGFIFKWLMSSQQYGLFNNVFTAMGLPALRWLDDSSTAMISVVIMNTWKSIGYYALIILSAMKSIPSEIYESARLDGSSAIKTFFKITIPMISPQLFFLLITITTGSFKVFDSVRIMTGGGPGDSTRVLSIYVYDFAFQRNNMLGYACAAGIVMMLIMVAVTVFDFAFVEKKVHYE